MIVNTIMAMTVRRRFRSPSASDRFVDYIRYDLSVIEQCTNVHQKSYAILCTCMRYLCMREVLGSGAVILLVHVNSAGDGVSRIADMRTAWIMLDTTDQCRHSVDSRPRTGEHGRYRAARDCVVVVLHHDCSVTLGDVSLHCTPLQHISTATVVAATSLQHLARSVRITLRLTHIQHAHMRCVSPRSGCMHCTAADFTAAQTDRPMPAAAGIKAAVERDANGDAYQDIFLN